MAQPVINITIENANTVIFKGEANALTSYNEKGIFDILPFHTHFISIIKTAVIIHHTDGKKQELPIDGGVLRVLENGVDVLLGIGTA